MMLRFFAGRSVLGTVRGARYGRAQDRSGGCPWKDAAVTLAVSDLRGTREGLSWIGAERKSCSSRVAVARIHDRNHCAACERPADRSQHLFHCARSQRQRRDFLRPVWSAKSGVTEIELARSRISRRVPPGRTISPAGWVRGQMEGLLLWPRLSPALDEPGRERTFQHRLGYGLFVRDEFLKVLDAYRYVERSIKYGVLFFVLVFTTFFLFEVTARQKIHPLQYLMVGAALCLFYLALLSASEFIGFSLSYLIATVAATGLITWYCSHFLGGGMRTLMIGGGLRAFTRSLHHASAAGLRAPDGNGRAFRRARAGHVCDSQGRLVCAGCELRRNHASLCEAHGGPLQHGESLKERRFTNRRGKGSLGKRPSLRRTLNRASKRGATIKSRRRFVLTEQLADPGCHRNDGDDDKFLGSEEKDPEPFEKAELRRHSAGDERSDAVPTPPYLQTLAEIGIAGSRIEIDCSENRRRVRFNLRELCDIAATAFKTSTPRRPRMRML